MRKEYYEKVCQICGAEFIARHGNKRTCPTCTQVIDDTDEAYGECCFDWDIKMPTADDFCSRGERKESE